MTSPFDLSWAQLWKRQRGDGGAAGAGPWPRSDVVFLKLVYLLQRSVELWGRRPCDAQNGLSAVVRRVCAGVAAGLPLIDARSSGWRDAIALDLNDDDRRACRVEGRIRDALALAPIVAIGAEVVMVIPSLSIGGSERQMVQHALALKRTGRVVRVIVKHAGEARFDFYRSRLISAQIPVDQISLSLDQAVDLERGAAGLSAIPPIDLNLYRLTRALMVQFRRSRPDVVHAWMDEMGAAAALAATLSGVRRVVIDCRSLRPTWFETRGSGSIRALLRMLAGRPEVKLVNNSEAGAEDYRRWLGAEDTIHVVLNSLDGASFAPESAAEASRVSSGPRVVGGMMRLSRAKQPELWIEVARRFSADNHNTHFWLFGDGPLRKRLERKIQRVGLNDRIFLKGTAADAVDALSGLDALLLTSDVEGIPNVLLEAQWLGVPVVARCVGGVPEAVSPALGHLLVKDGSADFVAALHAALALDREWVRTACRPFIENRFNAERQLQQYLALYEDRS